jgi:hypothetical protein
VPGQDHMVHIGQVEAVEFDLADQAEALNCLKGADGEQ